MSIIIRITRNQVKLNQCLLRNASQSADKTKTYDENEFRVLNLKNTKNPSLLRRKPKPVGALPPRANQMAVDQDWPSVWPGPKTFHPASVPLPVRQGYNEKGAPPGKIGNAELMKIPNFLHLTPPAIKKHCEVLSKFCTPWPANLDTEEKCRKHFPVKIISSDYCHASPTIRDPLARIVSIKLKLEDLKLDSHARDKFLRLVGDRYDPVTDEVTIVTDRCPTKKQNYDYAIYLLTALYHESCTVEEWESEKSESDMEYYDWETSKAKKTIAFISEWSADNTDINVDNVDVSTIPHANEYRDIITELRNNGENDLIYEKYATVTRKLFNLPPPL
ncbi:28S ribosomal protein S35, mitochondrial [Chrysoperla carnea]|uniref:28S ribosomal protein S35, mitochondrial n=1 Tax=Chrysoperla carnea TaxID=189513 RepID=UPI001D08D9C0|nr:28S ribosomal protein S35, mitochondrial [Chrysoperla carnea]